MPEQATSNSTPEARAIENLLGPPQESEELQESKAVNMEEREDDRAITSSETEAPDVIDSKIQSSHLQNADGSDDSKLAAPSLPSLSPSEENLSTKDLGSESALMGPSEQEELKNCDPLFESEVDKPAALPSQGQQDKDDLPSPLAKTETQDLFAGLSFG